MRALESSKFKYYFNLNRSALSLSSFSKFREGFFSNKEDFFSTFREDFFSTFREDFFSNREDFFSKLFREDFLSKIREEIREGNYLGERKEWTNGPNSLSHLLVEQTQKINKGPNRCHNIECRWEEKLARRQRTGCLVPESSMEALILAPDYFMSIDLELVGSSAYRQSRVKRSTNSMRTVRRIESREESRGAQKIFST